MLVELTSSTGRKTEMGSSRIRIVSITFSMEEQYPDGRARDKTS